MKNKIKKILLLGMTAMFTAGAAGTAVISCPVWADEAEQNSETAEEPKAEDAAVEEKIADQTDDKTENTDLKTVEHPRMSAYSIRRFSIVKDGEEVFQIKQEPADYKMDFDYWEITNPYDETATVNTENMYEMFGVLAAFDLSNGVDAANTDTGLDNTKTYFTVDFVNTVNDDTAKETQDADATATILIGNTDENGDYYACVKGYEEAVYLLSKESVNSLLELKPFNLILKIPALVNIDTLDSVDMSIGKKTYTMKLDGSDYKFGKKTVKKEKFTELYQALQSIMLDSEVEETKDAADKEEVLTVTFHRNTEEAPEITLKYFAFDLSNGVDAANTDTGLDNTKTYFTVDFVNTVNDDTAKETQDADATATILIGNTDENGDYYACVKGYEEAVYLLSKESVNSLLELKPFNLILKIPALVNIDTLDSVDMSIGKKTYTMKLDGSDYKFGKKTVKKEKFTELYQALQSIMLDSEVEETKDAADKEEVLTVTFHRNTEEAPEITLKYFAYDDTYDSLEINGTERFLVKAEDVDALVKQIKKAF